MPDDQRILFTSDRAGQENLWEIGVEDGSFRQVTTGPGADNNPSVARDGRIAYSLFSHQQDLYVVSLEDGSHERLTSHTRDNYGARISPDGHRIAYHSSRTGNPEIWIIDRQTGAETSVTHHPANDTFPGWSPDGQQLAFVSDREGEPHLWVVNADGSGGLRRITADTVWLRSMDSIIDYGAPRWSPDGEAIGFLATSEHGPALMELDLASGEVSSRLHGVETFAWYRDRDHVIYTPTARNAAGHMEMRAVDLRTGREAVLLEEPHTELIAARDGTAVAYCRAASHLTMQLYYLALEPPAPESPDGLPSPVGEPVQLTDGYGKYHVHNGGWSPDGGEIVYTRDIDAGDIYVIESD
jgi:Tol biopolymer transport system component